MKGRYGRQTSSRRLFSRKFDRIVQVVLQHAIKAILVLSTRKMVIGRQKKVGMPLFYYGVRSLRRCAVERAASSTGSFYMKRDLIATAARSSAVQMELKATPHLHLHPTGSWQLTDPACSIQFISPVFCDSVAGLLFSVLPPNTRASAPPRTKGAAEPRRLKQDAPPHLGPAGVFWGSYVGCGWKSRASRRSLAANRFG